MVRLLAEQVLLNPTQCGETCVKANLVFPACQYLSISLATLFPGIFQPKQISLIFFYRQGFIFCLRITIPPPILDNSYFLLMLGIGLIFKRGLLYFYL